MEEQVKIKGFSLLESEPRYIYTEIEKMLLINIMEKILLKNNTFLNEKEGHTYCYTQKYNILVGYFIQRVDAGSCGQLNDFLKGK